MVGEYGWDGAIPLLSKTLTHSPPYGKNASNDISARKGIVLSPLLIEVETERCAIDGIGVRYPRRWRRSLVNLPTAVTLYSQSKSESPTRFPPSVIEMLA